jgi:hypothetical protein
MAMPPGYPDPADFQPGQIQEHRARWEFHRDADRGGQNVGQDFLAPEGSMVVDFETHETSRHNTRGAPAIRLTTVSSGPLNLPRGVHVGIRLTPGDSFPLELERHSRVTRDEDCVTGRLVRQIPPRRLLK